LVGHGAPPQSDAAFPDSVADTGPDEIMLILETETGFILRNIPAATALRSDLGVGDSAEEAVRHAATAWGLPDFVFRPSVLQQGPGVREIGDALLIVGHVGAVVQVKAREAVREEHHEVAWLNKRVTKAASQALRTLRTLARETPRRLTNERGRSIEIRGRDIDWVPVVIVDHHKPPTRWRPPAAIAGAVVVLLRRDWDFLFEQLMSTDAVIRYLHRISPLGNVALGEEAVRYCELAQADFEAPPNELDPNLIGRGRRVSHPLLPRGPAGHDVVENHRVLRQIMEDIACVEHPDTVDPFLVIRALAALDETPVSFRSDLGSDLLMWLADVQEVADPGLSRWRHRVVRTPQRPQVVFSCTGTYSELTAASWQAYVVLRHHQLLASVPSPHDQWTVGVLLTPRNGDGRDRDTTFAVMQGASGLTSNDVQRLEAVWGPGI
jgi:hypothetical protein